jgi:hypothetical protein
LAAGLTATLAVVVVGSACTAKVTQVGAGGECFLATDCAPGLICIEQADKTRICSDDLSRVAGRPPAEPEEADGGGGEGGMPEASANDVTQPPEDTGAPDTSPPDTGAPPPDSGAD